ncbi:MAG: helix-turn-helix transcriptional regulator [Rhizomicrobium sp.]
MLSPMTSPTQREQLSEFLRNCRARLTPNAVGLPTAGRRRTPGLRREDVAALAGLSATWYTWLEQGRDVRASDRVLENLSRSLKLSAEERDYLFLLAQRRPAPIRMQSEERVPDTVKRTLDALNVPAEVITPRWDVVYWNAMVTRCFRDYGALPPERRNLLRILMTSPEYQEDPEEYEALVRRITAKLRVDYCQADGDLAFDALIEEMAEASPVFREQWRSSEVRGRSEGVHLLKHPQLGGITFVHTSYVVEGASSLRVVIFAPHDAESARKVAELSTQANTDEEPAGRGQAMTGARGHV